MGIMREYVIDKLVEVMEDKKNVAVSINSNFSESSIISCQRIDDIMLHNDMGNEIMTIVLEDKKTMVNIHLEKIEVKIDSEIILDDGYVKIMFVF